MKISKTTKIIVTILLLAVATMIFSNIVLATSAADASISTTFGKNDSSGASQAAGNIIGTIINIAQIIGMGVAILMLIVLAIQYIAASPEGKAEIKKNSTIYIVGAVILFAASGILGIIRRFAIQNVGNDTAFDANAGA